MVLSPDIWVDDFGWSYTQVPWPIQRSECSDLEPDTLLFKRTDTSVDGCYMMIQPHELGVKLRKVGPLVEVKIEDDPARFWGEL